MQTNPEENELLSVYSAEVIPFSMPDTLGKNIKVMHKYMKIVTIKNILQTVNSGPRIRQYLYHQES